MPKVQIEGFDTIDVEKGKRLLNAISESGVNIGHRCGGHARCTTCRVEFVEGEPEVMTEAEYDRLETSDLFGTVRLACQIVVDRDMKVRPLMRLETEDWSDTGPEPTQEVTPVDEWYPIDELKKDLG